MPEDAVIAALVRDAAQGACDLAARTKPQLQVSELGRVLEVSPGIVRATGLRSTTVDECVIISSGALGVVSDLTLTAHGITMLDPVRGVFIGDRVRRTGRTVSVPVGDALLGRVVDPLGRPKDLGGPVKAIATEPVERPAPPINVRAPVNRPLATGLKIVDAVVPVGLGQRELIIGNRQTGKTSIAVDAILNQRDRGTICVYCAIGQRADAVARVVQEVADGGMADQTLFVVADGDAPPGALYLAPYAATTMAEHFVTQGRDVLIVYDDLTRHARAYRELSLLLRRPPGREAYPGDIFYVHARLLERSGQFSGEIGNGSLTALPIVETQAENLSAYIPTNLISITDGQIYASPRLFEKGRLPAVDLGKSVSRVGGKAQLPALRPIAGDLRIAMSQFEELETFARFGTRLDDTTKAKLTRGRAVRTALRQAERCPLPMSTQIAHLLGATQGVFDELEEAVQLRVMQRIEDQQQRLDTLDRRIWQGEPLRDEDTELILQLCRSAVDGST